jgi:hypothetical protein
VKLEKKYIKIISEKFGGKRIYGSIETLEEYI